MVNIYSYSSGYTQNYCNVPLASDGDSVDLVPSFYEEYSSIVNSFTCDLDTDDDHDAVPHLHVDPKYIPRNVDRREERKEERIRALKATVKMKNTEIRSLNKRINAQDHAIAKLQAQLNKMKEELVLTKDMLHKTNESTKQAQRQIDILRNRLKKTSTSYEAIKADFDALEDKLESVNEENELLKSRDSKCAEMVITSNSQLSTKEGRYYSPAIRQLYYLLLSKQVSPTNAANVIKAFIQCFQPNIDIKNIILPKIRCASNMRREELKTLEMVHTAYDLSELISQGKELYLNSDGTTKNQCKINGIAINGKVFSLNEVPDGSAESIIDDIDRELEKLRRTAHKLGLKNANHINWTLIKSSTSDDAAAQKKFNRLIIKRQQEDAEKFGGTSKSSLELVENFCAMHLGINLRKAFLEGLSLISFDDCNVDPLKEGDQLETFIYEFAKLFGKHGVPEYAIGVIQFGDFLNIYAKESDKDVEYYQLCQSTVLQRQIGNRYFVSASNSGKILFLAKAAITFLEYTGRCSGNKLEKTVYEKLKDPVRLAGLKADSLMFYHVYADLVMLAKSKELGKSVLDMGKHYLELKLFLEKAQIDPSIILNNKLQVFPSEQRLYTEMTTSKTAAKFNHREHASYQYVMKRLFEKDEWDDSLLLTRLSHGCKSMADKLITYAKDQLPDGRYWDPEPETKEILSQLEPNNDLCESILGLNDYLFTTIPNMDQLTRSNMVQIKKNKTMEWLDNLPNTEQEDIVRMAMKNKREVAKSYKELKNEVSQKRRDHLVQKNKERELAKQKREKEIEKLSKIHLINSVSELNNALSYIDDNPDFSNSKKKAKKTELLKEQVKYRKQLLNQNVKVVFTSNGKQRPLTELIKEIEEIIIAYKGQTVNTALTATNIDATALVGKKINHKFIVDEEEIWYTGSVISYNNVKKLHTVVYDDEDEPCYFNLLEDLAVGDLVVIEDS